MKIGQSTLFSALVLSTLSLGGCAMAKPETLIFEKHNIKLKCFDASDLKIGYGNYRTHGLNDREYAPNHQRDICPSKKPSDDTKYLSGGMGYYRSFEGSLRVQWHALDDSVIDTTINLDDVFPDKIIPHHEDPKRIYWPIPTTRLPFIVIEINDRILNIYSDVDISILPEDGNVSNRTSHRNRTLMFSKTY